MRKMIGLTDGQSNTERNKVKRLIPFGKLKNQSGDFFKAKKKRHRTATTAYPCFLPDLGDSAGAGRAARSQR